MEEAQPDVVDKNQENLKPSPGTKTSSDNSEYDSVDSYSDEEQPELTKARSKASGVESRSPSEADGSVILEREEGDGQESVPQKRVDDDEDKKNPQYIPKRGTFYEHDDRTTEDVEAEEPAEAEKTEKDAKKKVWQDKKEKWSHDRFNDDEQAPKSRAELIAIYGYDIRNEEGPPRARRRRRYGRGPNKYTRNWEDEEAYTKPPAQPRPKRVGGARNKPHPEGGTEEFPPLNSTNDRSRTKSKSSDSNRDQSQDYKENESVVNKRQDAKPTEKPVVEQQPQTRLANPKPMGDNYQDQPQNSRTQNQPPRIGTGRTAKPKKEIKDSDYRGFTAKSRQQRGVRSEHQKVLPPRNSPKVDYIQTQNFTNKNNSANQIAEMEKEINQLDIQDGVYKGGKNAPSSTNQNRQGSVPPRLQGGEQKGPKRYSSMRQRSLPEAATPPAPAGFSFYPNVLLVDYNSTAPPPATQQPILPPPPQLVAPQVPVTATAAPPILQAPFAPPTAFATTAPPTAYMQAAPPPFIAAPPTQPQIVGYVPQAQAPYVPGFQGQFNAVAPPTELYQPQGGITYYSADQQVAPRQVPQKRPKAAIPIVAPTDFKEEVGAATEAPPPEANE